MANFLVGGSVQLYHNGSEKLETTSTGVDVTGTVTADGLTVDGILLDSSLGYKFRRAIQSFSRPY